MGAPGEPIVVVSGLPRSGTSMMMRMLEAGGMTVLVDEQRLPDEDNPVGYFEDQRVKALVSGADTSWLSAARGKAIKVISRLLAGLPPEHAYRVILMRRDLGEVPASQMRMLARHGQDAGVPDDRLRALFEKDLQRTQALLAENPAFTSIEVAYADVVRSPRDEAFRVAGFVGRSLDVDRMVAAVDARLYRNRQETSIQG